MPHIHVKLAAGRSPRLKRELADRLARAMEEVLSVENGAISVAIEDVPTDVWMDQVYGPDIEGAGALLIKPPGYGPMATALSQHSIET